MKFFSLLAAVSAALAAESGLNVRLEYCGGTNVKVIATNNGQESLKLLNLGTLFDDHSPVRKVSAEYASGAGANFTGVQVHPARQFLTENSFTQIQPGKTYQSTVDMAQIYDLRSGGRINIKAQGNTPVFDADLKPAGMIEHTSNILSIEIDPHAAAESHKKHLAHKRAYTDQSCPSDRAATVAGAISDCYTYAYWSKQEALYGRADRMQDFFKADDQNTRQKVGEVFDAIMKECQNGPKSDMFCLSGDGQKYKQCPDGVVAYTHFDSLDIQLCDIWFTRYDARTRYCHGADRASLFLHETTHATKGTQDLAYFYENVIKLPTDKALINADTYALFAQDSWGFCDGKPKRYQVYACNDVNFGGRCFGIQGSPNIDPAFDNQSSSLGGTSLGDCTVYRDYDCKGPSFKLAQSQQMNYLPDGFNDQISSVYC